jgi:hypothetical protein
MPNVTYQGPSSRSDSSTVLYIDGQRFDAGFPVDVDDELLAEIREGSDRLRGYKFEVEEAAPKAEKPKPPAPAQTPEKG